MDGGDWLILAVIGYGFYSCMGSDDKTAETKDNKPEVVVEIGRQEGRGMGNVIRVASDTPGRFPPKPAPAALKPQKVVEEAAAQDADDLFKDVFDETLFDQ